MGAGTSVIKKKHPDILLIALTESMHHPKSWGGSCEFSQFAYSTADLEG